MQDFIDILNQEYIEFDEKYNASRDHLDELNRFLNSNILYKIKKLKGKRGKNIDKS